MRHQLDYADSLRRESAAVLGLLLKPYSIGMELELLRARSPFMLSQQFSEIAALPPVHKLQYLIFACDVCSQSESERAESGRLLNGGFHWWQWRKQSQKFRLEKIWEQWNTAISKMDIAVELEKFWQYLCAGKTGPEFAKPEGDMPSTPIGAPEMCLLLHYVKNLPERGLLKCPDWKKWGKSPLDFPVAVARYEYYTLLESQGKAQLKSDFVQTFGEWCSEQDEKVANGEIELPDLKGEKCQH